MRSFSVKLFKNIILIYLCALICFIYTSMMDAIPEHILLSAPVFRMSGSGQYKGMYVQIQLQML